MLCIKSHLALTPLLLLPESNPPAAGLRFGFYYRRYKRLSFCYALWLCGAFGKIPVFNDRLIKGDKTNEKSNCSALSTCIIFLVCVEGARAYEFRWERRFVPSGISHISAFFAVYRTAECDICHGKTDKTLENLISVLPVLDMFSSKLYNLCNDAYGDFRMLCTSTAYVSGRMRLRKFLNGGKNMK